MPEPQTITLAGLMLGTDYTPVPGLAYELGEGGKVRRLALPTVARQKKIAELRAKDTSTDPEYIAVITEGDDIAHDDLILPMVSQVVTDFFTCAGRTVTVHGASEPASDPQSEA